MKWISFVEVENFKIHRKKTRVNFSQFFNVINGASDMGKSTLLKAMNKCLHNKPDKKAEDFMSWGAPRGSKTSIAIGVKDDFGGKYSEEDAPEHIITRVIGKSVNEYHITYPNGTVSEPYVGFGKKVPPEILEIHGMREVDMGYGKEQLNYISQFDGFFLINKRPDQIATAIGRLAQTDIIDEMRDDIRSDISSNTRKMNEAKAFAEAKNLELTKFNWIEGAEDAMVLVRVYIKELMGTEMQAVAVKDLSRKMVQSADKLKEINAALSERGDYKLALSHLAKAEENLNSANLLVSPLALIDRAHSTLVEISRSLENKDNVMQAIQILDVLGDRVTEAEQVKAAMSRTRMLSETLDGIRDHMTSYGRPAEALEHLARAEESERLAKLVADFAGKEKKQSQSYIDLSDAIEKLKASRKETLEELADAMEGKCPMCGSEVDANHLVEMSRHISEF